MEDDDGSWLLGGEHQHVLFVFELLHTAAAAAAAYAGGEEENEEGVVL